MLFPFEKLMVQYLRIYPLTKIVASPMFIIKQIFFGSRIYFHSQNKLICESFILIDGNGVVSYETDGIGNDASHNAVSDYSN